MSVVKMIEPCIFEQVILSTKGNESHPVFLAWVNLLAIYRTYDNLHGQDTKGSRVRRISRCEISH